MEQNQLESTCALLLTKREEIPAVDCPVGHRSDAGLGLSFRSFLMQLFDFLTCRSQSISYPLVVCLFADRRFVALVLQRLRES